jgi:hypothetical protein
LIAISGSGNSPNILKAVEWSNAHGIETFGITGFNGGKLKGLAAYSAGRPPHSEGLAIFIASYLANETDLPNINLLHLTSRKAVLAALQMAAVFPHINFRREVTIGHLMLDTESKAASLAKVNPPIRPREDVDYLWEQLVAGNLDWVCSDHACCKHEMKVDKRKPGNIWLAKSGFGGTEYLLAALVSEGRKRGLTYNQMAALTSYNAARRFGLHSKGDIAEGFDETDADAFFLDVQNPYDYIPQVRAALKPGGFLLVVDVFHGQPGGELNSTLYELGLALRTDSGRVHGRTALETCVTEAGFAGGVYHPVPAPPYTMGMIVARKGAG